jgi:hypothetical protein
MFAFFSYSFRMKQLLCKRKIKKSLLFEVNAEIEKEHKKITTLKLFLYFVIPSMLRSKVNK